MPLFRKQRVITKCVTSILAVILLILCVSAGYAEGNRPIPLLEKGTEVDWWFVFKFNTAYFPGCDNDAKRDCLFGGPLNLTSSFIAGKA